MIQGHSTSKHAVDPTLQDRGWGKPPDRMNEDQPGCPQDVCLVAGDQGFGRRLNGLGAVLSVLQAEDRIKTVTE